MDPILVKRKRKLKIRQAIISDLLNKEGTDVVVQQTERYWYQMVIPFSVANLASLEVKAIGNFGQRLKPPPLGLVGKFWLHLKLWL